MRGGTLRTRAVDIVERMDMPECDGERLMNTYRHFDRVNAAVSRWRQLYTRYVRPALRDAGPNARVLDIGCGGGDVLRHLAAWAAHDGLTPCFVGADPDTRAIDHARREHTRWESPRADLRFVCTTSEELATAGERFDVVLSNHVLHHLTDAEVVALCNDSAKLATKLVLHADIHRHPLAYAGFPLIGGWFWGSFILEDGLASIRRSFTPEELSQIVPEGWQVRTGFPFRIHLLWTGSSGS